MTTSHWAFSCSNSGGEGSFRGCFRSQISFDSENGFLLDLSGSVGFAGSALELHWIYTGFFCSLTSRMFIIGASRCSAPLCKLICIRDIYTVYKFFGSQISMTFVYCDLHYVPPTNSSTWSNRRIAVTREAANFSLNYNLYAASFAADSVFDRETAFAP